MPKSRKRQHSRSRSKETSRNDSRKRKTSDEKLEKLQEKLNNLTNVVTTLMKMREPQTASSQLNRLSTEINAGDLIMHKEDKENSQNESNRLALTIDNKETPKLDEITDSLIDIENQPNIPEKRTVSEKISKILGEDQDASKMLEINFHPELQDRWQKWMQNGLSKENKKSILEIYPRKGDLCTEAPKVNLEVIPILTEIAAKRDQHFIETELCWIGYFVTRSCNFYGMDGPEEGIDQKKFTKYLCDAGQLLTEVFYQQSIARKAFITPLMNKAVTNLGSGEIRPMVRSRRRL